MYISTINYLNFNFLDKLYSCFARTLKQLFYKISKQASIFLLIRLNTHIFAKLYHHSKKLFHKLKNHLTPLQTVSQNFKFHNYFYIICSY